MLILLETNMRPMNNEASLLALQSATQLEWFMDSRSVLITILVLVILQQVVKMIQLAYFHPLSCIPGSKFTASNHIMLYAAFIGRGHYLISLAHKLYGPVVRIAPNIISTADKDMIKEILVKWDFPKCAVYDGLELNDPPNIFTATDKSIHKNSRRMASPAFGLQRLRSLEPMIQENIQGFLSKIDQILDRSASQALKNDNNQEGGQVDIYPLIQRLSLDLFGEMAYSLKFNTVKDESQELLNLLDKSMKRSWRQGFNPWMKWMIPWDFKLFTFAGEVVRERKQQEVDRKEKGSDLLQFLIDSQNIKQVEDGIDLTKNEVVDLDRIVQSKVYTFLIGGSATVASPLTFILMYLVQNPDKLAKLREELDAATINNLPGDLPSHNQIRNLEYLNGCINESLRLRPSAAVGIPRTVTEDVNMGRWFVPAGTTIIAQTSQLHLDEKYFPEPYKFIPERWIAKESPFSGVEEGTFYPFSAGSRACIGQNFAMMQMKMVVAALVCNYEIDFIKGQRTDYVHYIVTLIATGSYRVALRKRNFTEVL